MKVVKVTWNQRVNAEANYSLVTEIVLDDDADAVDAGREAMAVVADIQRGMVEQAVADD